MVIGKNVFLFIIYKMVISFGTIFKYRSKTWSNNCRFMIYEGTFDKNQPIHERFFVFLDLVLGVNIPLSLSDALNKSNKMRKFQSYTWIWKWITCRKSISVNCCDCNVVTVSMKWILKWLCELHRFYYITKLHAIWMCSSHELQAILLSLCTHITHTRYNKTNEKKKKKR